MTESTAVQIVTDDAVEVEVLDGVGTVAALDKAAINQQIATARQYPREISRFQIELFTLATLDQPTAQSMFYTLKRGGKLIEGPSVRFAEVVASAWGNLRFDAKVIDIGHTFLTAQGTCMDLEKNVAARIEVRRRITNKHGSRYNDDMIVTTGNAACSIALRNAVFKVVPFAFAKQAYEAARRTATGEGKPMDERRTDALDAWVEVGGTIDQAFEVLGIGGTADMEVKDIRTLRGLSNAVEHGDTTVEAIVRDSAEKGAVSDLDEVFASPGEEQPTLDGMPG